MGQLPSCLRNNGTLALYHNKHYMYVTQSGTEDTVSQQITL